MTGVDSSITFYYDWTDEVTSTATETTLDGAEASLDDIAQAFKNFLVAAGYAVKGVTLETETSEFTNEY